MLIPIGILGFIALVGVEAILGFPAGKAVLQKTVEESSYENKCSRFTVDKEELSIPSDVKNGDYQCIRDKEFSSVDIKFNIGGNRNESVVMGSMIMENKVPVHVSYLCASACVNLVISSPQSSMCEKAILGIHQPYFAPIPGSLGDTVFKTLHPRFFELAQHVSTEFQRELLRKTDVDVEYYEEKIAATPHNDIHEIKAADALKYGFIDEIKKC